jgi:diguanylate cyclase
MTTSSDDHERTLGFAEIALKQIKALRQVATPRNFELWYTYATGHNAALNQAVNETLSRNGTLHESDVDRIYEAYISPGRITERIDHVGSQVMDEIEQVMSMIGAAAGKASNYSQNLVNVSQQLGSEADDPAVRAIVQDLVQATKEMEQNNQTLQARLSASKQEIDQLQEHLDVVRTESLTDPLTGLANRKSFDDNLLRAISEARAGNEHLSLLMMDIDHFKKFNDTFGHLTGDQVLRLVAMSVKQNIKGQDTAARYGGEEFAVILPNTVLRSAITVADHIRRAVMAKDLMKRSTGENLGHVTISIGVATLHPHDTPQSLIERADGCLYAAKRNGRNRVISEADPELGKSSASPKVA